MSQAINMVVSSFHYNEFDSGEFIPKCTVLPARQLIEPAQFNVIRYGSTDFRGFDPKISYSINLTSRLARYTHGEYVGEQDRLCRSLFIAEQSGETKFIYEANLDSDLVMPALFPLRNVYVINGDGLAVNLVDEIPLGVGSFYTPFGMNSYLINKRAVIFGNQRLYCFMASEQYDENLPFILTMLHEVGHANDAFQDSSIIEPKLWEYKLVELECRYRTFLKKHGREVSATDRVTRAYIDTIKREMNASTFARRWILAMEKYGARFLPASMDDNKFVSLNTALWTYHRFYGLIDAENTIRKNYFPSDQNEKIQSIYPSVAGASVNDGEVQRPFSWRKFLKLKWQYERSLSSLPDVEN